MIKRILARLKEQAGFSIIEILVSGLVLVIGLVMMSQFFASAAARVLDSDIRSVLHQVASQDVEFIRSLDYELVGTTNGSPTGILPESETRTVDNLTVQILRKVIMWTDDSYSGPYPGNYRRVTVTVSAVGHDRLDPVEVTTNVAGHVEGGTLDITVTNSAGDPVPNVQLRVTNTHLIPNVDLSPAAFKTDNSGHFLLPGLDPDLVEGYTVEASKSGYTTAVDGPKIVVDGLPYTTYVLEISQLSNLIVRVVDTDGNPVPGLQFEIVGPEGYAEHFTSSSSGNSFTGLHRSTSADPYIITLLGGQGYQVSDEKVELVEGTTQEVDFIVPAGGPTTTTTLPATTTTTVPG